MTDHHPSKSTTSLMGRVFPADDTRTTLVRLLLPILAAYLLKILIAVIFNNVRGQLGELAGILCLLSCLIGIGLIVFTVWLIGAFIRRDQYAAPLFILITGIMFVVIAPLPPLPQPVFPEESFFAKHRADFEAVVAMARQDQLSCSRSGCSYGERNLTSEYRYLSISGVVGVDHDLFSTLMVTFRPLDPYYHLIYFEIPNSQNALMRTLCTPDSRLTRKLDDHWYLCGESLD